MTAAYSYFMTTGTISKSSLIGSSGNNIENWAVQSDQVTRALRWTEPHREGTMRPQPQAVVPMNNQSARPVGFYKMAWGFKALTLGQWSYWLTTFFNTGATWSAAITLQTADDDAGGYSAYNAILLRPVPDQDYKILDATLTNVVFKIVHGVLIT